MVQSCFETQSRDFTFYSWIFYFAYLPTGCVFNLFQGICLPTTLNKGFPRHLYLKYVQIRFKFNSSYISFPAENVDSCFKTWTSDFIGFQVLVISCNNFVSNSLRNSHSSILKLLYSKDSSNSTLVTNCDTFISFEFHVPILTKLSFHSRRREISNYRAKQIIWIYFWRYRISPASFEIWFWALPPVEQRHAFRT